MVRRVFAMARKRSGKKHPKRSGSGDSTQLALQLLSTQNDHINTVVTQLLDKVLAAPAQQLPVAVPTPKPKIESDGTDHQLQLHTLQDKPGSLMIKDEPTEAGKPSFLLGAYDKNEVDTVTPKVETPDDIPVTIPPDFMRTEKGDVIDGKFYIEELCRKCLKELPSNETVRVGLQVPSYKMKKALALSAYECIQQQKREPAFRPLELCSRCLDVVLVVGCVLRQKKIKHATQSY